MIVSDAARTAVIGQVPGSIGAYAAARAMSALLFVSNPDPLTLAASAAVCLLIAVLGAVRPAMRAAKVDPMNAPRAQQPRRLPRRDDEREVRAGVEHLRTPPGRHVESRIALATCASLATAREGTG